VKILLDNCVDRRLAKSLAGHEVRHTSRVGLSDASNGNLLIAAANMGFDVLLTVDQQIRYQHKLEALPISVLELNTRDSLLAALEALAPYFEQALTATTTSRFVSLDKDGKIIRHVDV